MQNFNFINFKTKLKNYEHFVELTSMFDSQYGTKTCVSKTTLKNIGIAVKRDNNWVNTNISFRIKNIFANSNIIYSSGNNHTSLIDINASADLVNDIRNNVAIKHPICLFLFNRNRWFIHPGNMRLLFLNQYFEDVDVIVTNYSKYKLEKKINFKLYQPNDLSIDSVTGLDFFTYWSNSDARSSFKRRVGRKKYLIKEIEDAASVKILKDPKIYNPPRVYELKNNKVYMDNIPFLELINNNWYFCIM